MRCADITSTDGCEARSWWNPEKKKSIEDLEFIVEILIAFFNLEANAIDLRLMASTIIGFTTEKELLKQRDRYFPPSCLGMSIIGIKKKIEKILHWFPPAN